MPDNKSKKQSWQSQFLRKLPLASSSAKPGNLSLEFPYGRYRIAFKSRESGAPELLAYASLETSGMTIVINETTKELDSDLSNTKKEWKIPVSNEQSAPGQR
jgi:hypothetical protein